MRLAENIAHLFWNHTITSVLDLGAGKWNWSVFCASYGAKVVALDNGSKELWTFPEYLKQHPLITFLSGDIKDFYPDNDQTFDLILLFNVIVFLKKKIFLENILPFYLDKLTNWGTLCLTFFFCDDETMGKNPYLSFYDFQDFKLPDWYVIQKQQETKELDDHPPYDKHQHHIGYLEIARV